MYDDGRICAALPLAVRGNAEAQYHISCAYYDGEGVGKDLAKSAEWVKRSAEQGYVTAMYDYGWQLANGAGVDQDFYEAAKWYKKAADLGHTGAQNNLGVCYAYGQGVDQSYEEAAKYYALAAEGGEALAMSNLAGYYCDGLGVAQDFNKALELYEKAVEKGYQKAETGLARCYEKCAGMRDPNKAFGLYLKAAEGGDAIAQYNLAKCYESGTGTAADAQKALEWYEKSALADYLPAQRKAAELNWNKGNFTSAVKYYEYGRSNGDEYSQYCFAYAMYYGKGIREDKSCALYILSGLAKKGNRNAADMLGGLRARGIETDYNKLSREQLHSNSYEYFGRIESGNREAEKRNAEQQALFTCKSDDPQVVFECGEDYFYGRNGKTLNYKKALMQYKKAADSGHALSMYKAGLCYSLSEFADLKQQAVGWFKKAADAGYRGAYKHLYGIDKYMRLAAETGDAEACFLMGEKCLKEGDEKNGVKWFVKGYDGGNAKCFKKLCGGRGEEFKAYKRQQAESGADWAQYLVGEQLQTEGRSEDAAEWYRKAAEQGYGPACEKVAKGYAFGSNEQLEWLLKCTPCTFEHAYDVAEVYNFRKDYARAAEYYEIALRGLEPLKDSSLFKHKYVEVVEKLSNYYAEGTGVERDNARARELKLALVAVDPAGMPDYFVKQLEAVKAKQYYFIGYCYHHGVGCKADYDKAEEFYKKMSTAEQYRHGGEMHELLSHKCSYCGKYFYNLAEKKGLFGSVKLMCPHCGKKVGKK